MKRGDIVLMADRAGGDFAGKPRPAVIIQSDLFAATDSIVICPITSQAAGDAPIMRIALPAQPRTGLQKPSAIMVERMTSIRRDRIAKVVGRVSEDELLALNRSLAVFLGFA